MAGETQSKPAASKQIAVPEGKLRNGLIFGTLGVSAAIIFGVLYLFVIAPSAPAGGTGWSVGWFLFSFATGLTMIVMPCTLPLAFVIVPLSMGKGLLKGLSMALAFGIGVAATLSLYGIAAAVVGSFAIDSLGAPLESVKNWVYFIAGIFAFVFALSEIGLLNFHMPTYSGAAPAFIQKRQEVFKAFLLGLFLGNIGVGCPHPATPLLLIEIATSGDVLYGWLMFLTHAIGRVLPLLLLAFLAILGVNGLNWLMTRKDLVEKVTGWAMVFVAGFILTLGLFTHDWWVNSGIHSALESITQEAYFNQLLNETLDQSVAHVHGLEVGTGLFGLPLSLGHWFLVFVWLLPIWWWWRKKNSALMKHPSYRLKALEKKIDMLEKDRRQVESMVNLDEIETEFDLKARYAQLDALEAERRSAEEVVQYGETGEMKDPIAQTYEYRMLKMHRNYLIAISVFLALTFIHFMPQNFYLKSISGMGHGDHAVADPAHSHGAGAATDHLHSAGQSLDNLHVMNDGTVMNGAGEVVVGSHLMPDGAIMLADGTTIAGALQSGPQGTAFSTDISGLPDAVEPETVTLNDGDSYTITAGYVKKRVGNRTLRMLAYNGSVPGPFIKAGEGDEITINFTNNTDVDQTIHSHGVRLDNNFDGVPGVTQDAVKPGASYSYKIKFQDAGVYWYHPHTRDDYGQELGLYGNYLVDPDSPYKSPVNREVPLILDDILIQNDKIVNFYKEFANFALLGRFGNEFLVNGEKNYTLPVETGEVVRFMVTNVSNARTYNLSIPGVQMKLVGADIGKYERETLVSNVLISPAERMVVEVYFKEPGSYSLMNSMPSGQIELTRFVVTGGGERDLYGDLFNTLHANEEVVDEFADFRSYLNTNPNKRLLLTVALSGSVNHGAHAHGGAMPGTDRLSTLQWEDPGMSDTINTTQNVTWKLVDQDTGLENMNITGWTFKQGDLVKVRLTNDSMAAHVMQHPIHMHGQRFVVLSENGVPNQNLAWKDTVLVYPGETVDILVEMSNLGEWMTHCHISEHLHAGMMMPFRVEDQNGYATGDEYRSTRPSGSAAQNFITPGLQSGSPEQLAKFTFETPVPASTYSVFAQTSRFQAGKKQEITLSFFDQSSAGVMLSTSNPTALQVTFVRSDNQQKVFTFPGSKAFDSLAPAPVQTMPASDGHNHIHMNESEKSFALLPRAYAHGGVDDGHMDAVGPTYTYTLPVAFPDKGFYRAFVEFIPEGGDQVQVVSFDVEVAGSGFSVDNFGWSLSAKWWILLIISLVLMSLLSLGVRRYLAVKV